MPTESRAPQSSAQSLRNRIGGITRLNGPDDPRLPDARRDLAAARIAKAISAIVAAAPPLNEQQVAELTRLLRGPAATHDDACGCDGTA